MTQTWLIVTFFLSINKHVFISNLTGLDFDAVWTLFMDIVW